MLRNAHFFLLMGLLSPALDAHAENTQQDEMVIGVTINAIAQSKDTVLIRRNEQWLIICNDLQGSYFMLDKLNKEVIDGVTYCQINMPKIGLKLDENLQILNIAAPVEYLQGTEDFKSRNVQPFTQASLGGYLNYELYYHQDRDQKNIEDYNGQTELALFYKRLLLKNALVYRYSPDGNQDHPDTVRLFSNMVYELPDGLSYLQLGDNVSTANGLARNYYFGGVQWGTNFKQRPNYVYWSVPSIQGSALAPSTIDLYIDGVNAYNGKVNPGEFNIESGAFTNGSGSAQLIVEDVLGNKQVRMIDLFVSDRLMRQGLTDYSVSLGKLRYNYNSSSNDYREDFASAYLRRGINSVLTLGGQIEYSSQLQTAGLMSSNYVPQIGILELTAGCSQSDYGDGCTAGIGLASSENALSWGVNSQFYSLNYRIFGMDWDTYMPKRESMGYLSFSNLPYVGSVAFNYLEQIQPPQSTLSDSRIFSMRGAKNIRPNLYFSYGVSKDVIRHDGLKFDASLSYRFDSKHVMNLVQTNENSTLLSLEKSDSLPDGIDYFTSVGSMDHQTTFSADTRFKSNAGDLNVRYRSNGNASASDLNLRGAAVWLGNRLKLTKSADYPFALIQIPQHSGVDVYRNNAYVGKTDKNGNLFVHNLVPYTEQHLSINADQLSVEDRLDQRVQTIVPLDLRGYVLNFPVFSTHQLEFMPLDSNQNQLPTGSLIFTDNEQTDPYPIGINGTALIYGLTEGEHEFLVQYGKQKCRFKYTVSGNGPMQQDGNQIKGLQYPANQNTAVNSNAPMHTVNKVQCIQD